MNPLSSKGYHHHAVKQQQADYWDYYEPAPARRYENYDNHANNNALIGEVPFGTWSSHEEETLELKFSLRPFTRRRRLALFASFEDELVKIIQASPGQRVTKESMESSFPYKEFGYQKFQDLLKDLHQVTVTTIHKTEFLVLLSDPSANTLEVNKKALDKLEDEFVELLRSVPDRRIRFLFRAVENAYQAKYKKPLKIEPTRLYTLSHVVRAMTRVAITTPPVIQYPVLTLASTQTNHARTHPSTAVFHLV